MEYKIPLYIQLKQLILDRIADGEYLPGEKIPSEREMAATYKINRMTVKNAVNSLVEDGILYKEKNVGVFVCKKKANRLYTFRNKEKEGEVEKALTDSGLMERVSSMPNGLDTSLTTEIMEKGINLSGGESQKLAISRVFYQKAGLMILDEPSSALDPIAEYQLNHAMLSATKDKTVIFISHRLSTTRLADHIIMLEKGRIVERGNHEQLLQANGKYAEMWRVQAGAYIEV